jgi:hypothetical protein
LSHAQKLRISYTCDSNSYQKVYPFLPLFFESGEVFTPPRLEGAALPESNGLAGWLSTAFKAEATLLLAVPLDNGLFDFVLPDLRLLSPFRPINCSFNEQSSHCSSI